MSGMGEQKKTSLTKNSAVVGFALFAMFFGAGNLIFPPTLGQLSGDEWILGLLGFLVSDAVLSCLGVYIVIALGGPRHAFDNALGKVGSAALNAVAILCLCVVFAMPRTAATTFELSVAPYLGESADIFLIPFSILFFVVVYLLTFRKSRVVDIIGKFFTPTLVIGIIILIVAGIANPLGTVEAPLTTDVFQGGIRAGYQTMDVLGVAAFSLIIMDSGIVRTCKGSSEKKALLGRASIGAVAMLGIVYGGLTYLGATSVGLGSGMSQVDLLVAIVQALLGDAGMVLLSIIVLLACITTAVALVSSAADFFNELFKGKVSYRTLLVVDCIIGVVICAIGLDNIIRFADPVLGVVYPPFITVVVLLVFKKVIGKREVYQGAALGALFGGLLLELSLTGVLALSVDWLPFFSLGFGWVLFAVIGSIAGFIVGHKRKAASSSSPSSH